ncbi:MAG: tRNA (N6-isopentenyl adenosine(37)-C2)-methylthiotransferase MiaB [Deinococcus sp.]|nr:tRNA (N6-isopentenyl adenosine(37)-C2)-methylthiotransferase MiaB [Deinococcus sp.]
MRAKLITLGCQMNVYDSHILATELARIGYRETDQYDDADLVVVNTCAVREKPAEKLRSLLGLLNQQRKKRPMKIALAGCLMQLQGSEFQEKFHIDYVTGPGSITELPKLIQAGQGTSLEFIDSLADYVAPPQMSLAAHLTIIRGCDHACTYCIVPRTRGPQVSRPPEKILEEAYALRKAGVLEVTLLGQNVNAYGKDVPGYPSFAQVLRQIGKIFPRVRFLTNHPKDFTAEVIQAIAETPTVCRHLHLPVQSGSDQVLKDMNREYTAQQFIHAAQLARKALPGCSVTTDLIAGFPTETEEDFQATLALVDQVGFDASFTFIYSPRPGTPAGALPDLPQEVKTERLMRLIDQCKAWSLKRNQARVGQVLEVLVTDERKGDGTSQGYCRENIPVVVGEDLDPGIYQVQIGRAAPQLLFGAVLHDL